jgi:phytanoyl-CoA hydroxylase
MQGVGATQQQYHSRFGGLWIDRFDALEVLASKVAAGAIRPELAGLVESFMRDGYVILPQAVPLELTRRIKDELDAHWSSPPDGAMVETWEPDGTPMYVPPTPAIRNQPHKLLDFHAHSALARQACAAPAIVEFLSTIFGARPKAFQTLTFQTGSQQAVHKDTAYVRVEDEPMHLAATWLALEDVQPGSGELHYFVGSHRDPEFLFGGQHKWMVGAPEDHDRFLASLLEDAVRYGHADQVFRPREGDVLVWHADLAHGGLPITTPGSTRQSLVTHYTPETDHTPYERSLQRVPVEEHGCLFVSEHLQI